MNIPASVKRATVMGDLLSAVTVATFDGLGARELPGLRALVDATVPALRVDGRTYVLPEYVFHTNQAGKVVNPIDADAGLQIPATTGNGVEFAYKVRIVWDGQSVKHRDALQWTALAPDGGVLDLGDVLDAPTPEEVPGWLAAIVEVAAARAEVVSARNEAVAARDEAEQFRDEAGQLAAGDLIEDGSPSPAMTFSSQKVTDLLSGKSETGHTHSAGQVTSGTFNTARLPAASTTARGAVELATPQETVDGLDELRAVTPLGLAEALSGFSPSVTPQDFGAVGDGVEDDSLALQAFFDHVSSEATSGHIPAGTYRMLSQIVLEDTGPFTVRGDGAQVTVLDVDFPANGNGFNVVSPVGMMLAGFTIRNKSGSLRHGISVRDGLNSSVVGVEVIAPQLSGVMFHKTTGLPNTVNQRNTIAWVHVEGNGVAQNGVAHAAAHRSVIAHCTVNGLARQGSGSPSYALQLKNDCTDCHIIGGSVNGAQCGVVFGNDDSSTRVESSTVSGVIVRNCDYGFLSGPSAYNTVELTIDMAGHADNLGGVRLNGSAVGNTVTARVLNPRTGSDVVHVLGLDNTVRLDLVHQLGAATLARFIGGSQRNLVRVGTVTDAPGLGVYSAPIVNAGTENSVVYDQAESELSPASGPAWVRFPVPGAAPASWLSFNHSSGNFIFRSLGSDVLAVSGTNVQPQVNNTQSLGHPSRGFKELILSAPNGNRYRVTVNNSGTLSAAAV